jgi:2-polyprenyl-3-methyl-5-hydroxy-6-metoxy-1,4-benzoquinol methylase
MADHEDETIQTYDKYADSWASDHPPDDYDTILAQVLQLTPHGSVLEVGCGSGQDAEMLIAAGYDYLGTDAANGMVRLASQRHAGIVFQKLNLYELASLGRRFDIFWCNAVLLHIPKHRIDEALQSISAAVRSAGIGFISMKDGDKEVFEERTESDRQEKRIFVHWRKDDFEKVLKRNGFEVVYYEYVPKSERSKWHRFIVRKL